MPERAGGAAEEFLEFIRCELVADLPSARMARVLGGHHRWVVDCPEEALRFASAALRDDAEVVTAAVRTQSAESNSGATTSPAPMRETRKHLW